MFSLNYWINLNIIFYFIKLYFPQCKEHGLSLFYFFSDNLLPFMCSPSIAFLSVVGIVIINTVVFQFIAF